MDALQAPRTVLRVTARLYQRISAQIILILAFLGLVYFLVYFLLNSTFASRVFDQLVNSQFRGRIGWSRIQWGPLPWKLSVLDFVMADSQDQPVITARRVRIDDIQLLDLLSLRIAASKILIEDPVVRLVARPHPEGQDALGNPRPMMNIEEMFLPPPGVVQLDEGAAPPPLVLDFQDANVTNAHFILDLPQIVIDIQGIDIEQAGFTLAAQDPERSMTIRAASLAFAEGSLVLPREDLAGRLVADAEPHEVLRFGFGDGLARFFSWRRMQFTVASFTAQTQGDPLRVAGLEMGLDGPAPTLRASLGLEVAELRKHLEPLGISGISGPVSLRVQGQGELETWQARVEAAGPQLDVLGHAVGAWRLVALKEPEDRFVLEELVAEVLGGAIQVAAFFDLPRGEAMAEIELMGPDPGRLPELATQAALQDFIEGPINGRLAVRATDVLAPTRRVSLTADLIHRRTGRAVPGVSRTAEVALVAALDGAHATLHHLDLDVGRDHVEVQGGLDLTTLEAQARGTLRVESLAELGVALGQPIGGEVAATFEVSGSVSNPQGTLRLTGRGLRYADFPMADVDAGVRYADRVARVDTFSVATDIGRVEATGLVRLGQVPSFDLGVKLQGVDLGRLPGIVDIDMAGEVRTPRPITIQGPLSAPRISGRIEIEAPRYQRLQLAALTVDGTFAYPRVQVTELTVVGEGPPAEALWVAVKGALDLRAGTYDAQIDVQRLPLTLADAFTEAPLGLKGLLSLVFSGKGSLAQPHAEGRLDLKNFAYGAYAFKDTWLQITADGTEVRLNGRLIDAFDVQGQVPVRRGTVGSLTVAFKDLNPQAVLTDLQNPTWDALASGEITARFQPFEGLVESVIVRLDTLQGSWRLIDAQGQVVQTPGLTCPGCPTLQVAAARPIRLSFRHDVLTVDDFTFQVNQQYLGLAGTVGADGTLDLAVGGQADLALLRPFVQSAFTDFQGAAEIQLGVIGPISDPKPRGWVRLASLDLVPRTAVVGTDIHLVQPVEFEIVSPSGPRRPGDPRGVFSVIMPDETRATPERAILPNRFLIRRDESTLAVKEMGIEIENFGLERLTLALDANEVSLNVPDVVRGAFDFNDLTIELYQHRLRRRTTETRLKIGGDIEIQYLEYTADLSAPGAINQEVAENITGRSRARSVSVFERVPLLKRLQLDLRVHGDDEIYVRNNLAVLALELELKVDLTAKGFLVGTPNDDTEDLLALDGQIDVLDGSQLIYQRRPFEVNSGNIRFGGNNFLEVDINASHTFRLRTDQGGGASSFDLGSGGDVREEEVTLDLSVRMPTRDSEPRINPQLSSSSGASQIEVLTLLLTGQLPSDLTGAAGAQPATEALLGPVLNLIEAPLEETLDLDLSLTAATTGTLFVDVDKILSRRLRLYSRTPVGTDSATNPQTFGLEYRINNLATGELTTEQLGSNNATSGRLRLRLELD